uniref:FAM192A/Fyv6 N-terminal domain-containing protein n=1 Tax=Mastacembelus armatus TaxID=205130 RepID=A0A3Q3MQY6_9TELE
MAGGETAGIDLSRKFVSEAELDEMRKKRQEEWEKVRKPDDPEEVPDEEYDPRSLFDRLQEQKDKKQEEYEEQFKFSGSLSDSSSFCCSDFYAHLSFRVELTFLFFSWTKAGVQGP